MSAPQEILLAEPRGFCAGVDRAIEIVERAIQKFGAPIYVRHEIVHNTYVVNDLKAKGAIFIEDLAEVPPGATLIFSAHGVSRAVQDEARARVAIISRKLNDELFGGKDSIGKTLRLDGNDFRVVGVLDQWRPTPKFWDLYNDQYGATEDLFVPFSTSRDLKMSTRGSTNCWGDSGGETRSLNAPCAWVQYWVELDSAAKAGEYRNYLGNYSDQQRAAGRFQRPTNVRLRNVMDLLTFNKVVPSDVVMQLWLGFGFLLVCLGVVTWIFRSGYKLKA